MGRRTVDAYICDWRSRANRGDGCDDRRSGNFGNFDVDLRNVSAAERDRDGMAAGIARAGFHRRVIFVAILTVVIRQFKRLMLVRGRTVVVFRMIVPEVLVDMQRRHRGRRYDQGLHQDECDESAHEDSLSEAAPPRCRAGFGGYIWGRQECVGSLCRAVPVRDL